MGLWLSVAWRDAERGLKSLATCFVLRESAADLKDAGDNPQGDQGD